MKKALLLSLISLMPLIVFPQKIISESKKHGIITSNLKAEVYHYAKINVKTIELQTVVTFGTDAGGIWQFYNKKTKKPMEFRSDNQVLNFMFYHGWRLVSYSSLSDSLNREYIFEKK